MSSSNWIVTKRFIGYQDGSVWLVLTTDGDGPSAGKMIGRRESAGLARALLFEAIGDQRMAVALAMPFAESVVRHLPHDEAWIMCPGVVRAFAAGLAAKARAA